MKVTLQSTTRIVSIKTRSDDRPGLKPLVEPIKCRVWEGQTESGIKVQALILRIAALATEDLTEFEAELQSCVAPSAAVEAFPLSMIL